MKLILLLGLLFATNLALAQEVFLLTKSLDFSNSPGLKGARAMAVGKQPTLMKKLSEKNGVIKVQIFQQNGKSVNKTMYVSAKWFKRGTDSKAEKFHTDPNEIVEKSTKAPELECEEEERVVRPQPFHHGGLTGGACSVLDSNSEDVELYLKCFQYIQNRLEFNSKSAYKTLSKLYTLSPSEQKFMAMVLTMYGEARGARPTDAQMSAVMKVIENRTTKARESNPESNELDVVLQDSQFSMYNPKDRNWRAALTATPEEIREAVKVFATNGAGQCVSKPSSQTDDVYHYATSQLCNSRNRPDWIRQGQRVQMKFDGAPITSSGAHYFYADVPWTFKPYNRYRQYAEQVGDI